MERSAVEKEAVGKEAAKEDRGTCARAHASALQRTARLGFAFKAPNARPRNQIAFCFFWKRHITSLQKALVRVNVDHKAFASRVLLASRAAFPWICQCENA